MADRQHDAGSKIEGAEMTDDLVKRLREEADCYKGKTWECLWMAADRIERLEAALNCNLPDYDPKIGIVERLRQLGNWRVDGTKSSPIYNKSADHIEKLEAALRQIEHENTFPSKLAKELGHKCGPFATIARKALEGKDE